MRRSSIMNRLGLALSAALLLANAPLDDAQKLFGQGKEAEAFAIVAAEAAKGDVVATTQMGWFYENGRVVGKDPAVAAEFYRKAATKGDAQARWRLGVLIDQGTVEGDPGEAVILFKQAAYDGLTNAMTSLAVMYASGRGVAQDFEQMRMHYEMAARLGNSHAIQGLGVAYSKGEGVAKDSVEAAAYWLIARQLGNETAAAYLDQAAPALSAPEKQRASERAAELAIELGLAARPPAESGS